MIVHDEKVTVPLLTKTPPPCKHKGKTCENPIGAMGTYLEGLCGTYILLLTEASAAVVRAGVNASMSAIFPSGPWELSRSLRHVHTVVDRSVVRNCASENQSKRVSIFPIGAMGSFEHEHAHK